METWGLETWGQSTSKISCRGVTGSRRQRGAGGRCTPFFMRRRGATRQTLAPRHSCALGGRHETAGGAPPGTLPAGQTSEPGRSRDVERCADPLNPAPPGNARRCADPGELPGGSVTRPNGRGTLNPGEPFGAAPAAALRADPGETRCRRSTALRTAAAGNNEAPHPPRDVPSGKHPGRGNIRPECPGEFRANSEKFSRPIRGKPNRNDTLPTG